MTTSFSKDLKKFASTNNFDRYKTIAEANEAFKFNTINVPANGLCQLYSFQAAFLIDHGRLFKLEAIKRVILEEFKNLVSYADLSVFLSNEDTYQLRNQSKIVISSAWQDPVDNSLQVNIFNLIKYLEMGIFNASIVDIIPRLLAYGFKCEISIYEYAEGCILFKDKFSPRTFHDQMRIDNSLDADDHSLPNLNILFLKENMHYVALARSKLTDHKLEQLSADSSKSVVSLISKDKFYAEIANNFQTSI